MINPEIFRTYDIRGIYPDSFNENAIARITRAYLHLWPQVKKIVVSHDPRLSSPSLAKTVIEEITKTGRDVIYIGISPDSLFYFSLFRHKFDGGFQISGSHNDKRYNGLSLSIRKEKEPVDIIKKDLERIKNLVLSGREIRVKRLKKGKGRIIRKDFSKEYIEYVSKKVRLERPLKIVVDSGNGSEGFLPERLFKKLGCKVKTIYGEFNGDFPHHLPNPYDPKNLKDLLREVKKEKADVGFAFDSDGDRVTPIDDKGRIVTGDQCMIILAREEVMRKKGPVIHCMRASLAFLEDMRKLGVKTYFSVSHHSAIIKNIKKKRAVFGGEITYHFLFPLDYYLCDDALFASLKIARIASLHYPLSEYIDSLPHYFPSPEIFIPSADEDKFEAIERLKKVIKKKGIKFISIDGARINWENGWSLFRASNTEPLIKCRFEGKTKKDLKEIKRKSLNLLRESKIKIPVSVEKKFLN